MSRGPGQVQRGVQEYLRAQPAEHTGQELERNEDGSSEWVDVACPWPGFVALDRIAAEVTGEPVTRAGLESVRRVVKAMAADGHAELGWWTEQVLIGEPRIYSYGSRYEDYPGEVYTTQRKAERRKLAVRRALTEAEAAAEDAHYAAQQAKRDAAMQAAEQFRREAGL